MPPTAALDHPLADPPQEPAPAVDLAEAPSRAAPGATRRASLERYGPTAAGIRREVALHLDHWRAKSRFSHQRTIEYLRFIVPEASSVLLIGCEDGVLLSALKPSRAVGVDSCPDMIALARQREPAHRYVLAPDYRFDPVETFDYVVLHHVVGEVHELYDLLESVARCCSPKSRVVIVQHNYLWRPMMKLASVLGLKRPEARQNWLSPGDIGVFLDGAGLEVVDEQSKLYCPVNPLGLGSAINWVCGLLPFVHRLASTQLLVARPIVERRDPATRTASIVLTTRDERENIEPMVRSIPELGAGTEIIFVEGHSTDGTREEILRVIEAYPEKNIRLLTQTGFGQGDAIRLGFSAATGDVIILVEADQTSPAADARKAFDLIASGRADYVSGGRFIYPRERGAMPLRNVLGNWAFAVWFTWFLGRRTSDVLCGLKAIDRDHFLRLRRNWGFLGLFDPFGDFELIFGAARLGLKISEVPTRYTRRLYGQTKSRFVTHGWMLVRMAVRATRVFKCR